MVIHTSTHRAKAWQALPADARETDSAPLHDWYETNAAAGRILGGEELAWPRDRIVIAHTAQGARVDHQPEAGDSALSGFMTIEVESVEAAIDLATSWPDLRSPGDRIELVPVRDYDQP